MKNREVSGSVVFANAAVILVKGDVEHPVQAVLNVPAVRRNLCSEKLTTDCQLPDDIRVSPERSGETHKNQISCRKPISVKLLLLVLPPANNSPYRDRNEPQPG